ncbi:hypothetical protein, partial [Rothia mucilaginosa]
EETKTIATSLSIPLRLALPERKYRTHFVINEHLKTIPRSIFKPKNHRISAKILATQANMPTPHVKRLKKSRPKARAVP